MDLDDVVISPVIGYQENEEKPTSVDRLQNLVHKLEQDNDLPSPKNSEKTLSASLQNGGGINGHADVDADIFSLENTSAVSDFEFDTNVDSEDSWLYESPQKINTPGKNLNSPDKWLKDNITTPDLMRVRGSLSAKLDVINIEKRKGRFSNTDPQQRKTSYDRKASMNSVHSLDWDYDEEKRRLRSSSNRMQQPNEEFDGYTYDEEFDPEKELNSAYNNMQSNLERQAWSEPAHRTQVDGARPFSLDWSDEEDDLIPMKIDFNQSPSQGVQPRSITQNGAIIRRGAPGINTLATPRNGETYDYDEFVAKPTSGVKPRRAMAPPQANHNIAEEYDNTDYGYDDDDDDFDNSAPVVPRGAVKRDTPSPRNSAGIAKPVQRRQAGGDSSNGIRPRGSGNNGIKPRGSSNMASDMGGGDPSLVGRIPGSGGDGPVLRRRGAGGPGGGVPAPRKSKESPQIARVQGGIPQVRRSTGSIPQKSGDAIARPRRSASPSGIVRPRGSGGVSQSVQANY